MKDVDPRKELIVEEISKAIARYKLGPEDKRSQEDIEDTWFDYLLEKLDWYC